MSGTLAWLTFVAALIAAVGTFVGPIIAYRASIRTIQGEQQIESTRQRQEIVDRLIEQATGTNARLSTYALAQLEYLLVKKLLNTEQTEAARNAIDAVTARLEPEVEGGVRVEEDGDVERGTS